MSMYSNYDYWLRNLSSNNFNQEEANLKWVIEYKGARKEAIECAKNKLNTLIKIKEERQAYEQHIQKGKHLFGV